MKKAVSAAMLAVMLLSILCACGRGAKVSVNGTKIDEGVYRYFLDNAKTENPDGTEPEQQSLACAAVSEYVAVNSEFANRGLRLTAAEKNAVSQTVNNYWHLFSAYYESIGVSKQSLLKIEESKKCRDALLVYYYGETGDAPVSEDTLKTYFYENYIAFKTITGFLTTVNANGEATALSDAEKETLLRNFSGYASTINEGSSIDDVGAALENINISTDTIVISKTDTGYPAGFFDRVYAIEANHADSFSLGDYAFVVQREDITDADRDLFSSYRISCLKMLKGADFDAVLAQWMQAYPVEVK